MNYRRDEQSFISLQEILDACVNNYSEKKNYPLQVKELGMILKGTSHRRVESREQ